MQLTLKEEAQARRQNFLQQQAKFDDFLDCYNHDRPRQALDMKCPAELYRPSPRPYHALDELHYPFTTAPPPSPNAAASASAAARSISAPSSPDRTSEYDLGFFDHETARLGSVENPFAPKVLPMSLA